MSSLLHALGSGAQRGGGAARALPEVRAYPGSEGAAAAAAAAAAPVAAAPAGPLLGGAARARYFDPSEPVQLLAAVA